MKRCTRSNAALPLARAAFSAVLWAGCAADDGADKTEMRSSYFGDLSEAGRPNLSEAGTPVATARDAASGDATALADAAASTPSDAGALSPLGDAAFDSALPIPLAEAVARGRYLVHHVAACVECHTPRDLIGRVDTSRLLSGVECFRDVSANQDKSGCLHTGNLTHHETGLKNRSDLEIKAMFMEGVRPNGQALHPAMPYWVFGNMNEADADAIVRYLRTVPGINHMVPASKAPFRDVPAPAQRWPAAQLPASLPGYLNQQAAARGRYLATSVGSCLDCHTPRKPDGSPDIARAFRGGFVFQRGELGLPAQFFPATIASSNLTPHADGLLDYTVKDIVTALKTGSDRQGMTLCPPMPSGMGAFGGLTDADAEDIAHYLLSLAPLEGKVDDVCAAPF